MNAGTRFTNYFVPAFSAEGRSWRERRVIAPISSISDEKTRLYMDIHGRTFVLFLGKGLVRIQVTEKEECTFVLGNWRQVSLENVAPIILFDNAAADYSNYTYRQSLYHVIFINMNSCIILLFLLSTALKLSVGIVTVPLTPVLPTLLLSNHYHCCCHDSHNDNINVCYNDYYYKHYCHHCYCYYRFYFFSLFSTCAWNT